MQRDNLLGFKSIWLGLSVRVYDQGFKFRGSGFSLQFMSCKQEATNCLPALKL